MLLCAAYLPPAGAQVETAAGGGAASVLEYPAAFFSRYKPGTALDMVIQVPAFQVDDGDGTRGFAGAAGNLLINGRRPSAKQDKPSAILSRIPASQVLGIELINGQARGIDLRGQSTVVNVLLSDDAPAAIQWESSLLYTSVSPVKPGVKASLADRWRGLEYNIGIDLARDANGEFGDETVHDAGGNLLEYRDETQQETGFSSGLYVNASSYLGETFFHVNGKFGLGNAPEVHDSDRYPAAGGAYENYVKYAQHSETYELGVDAERELGAGLSGKAILLYINKLSDVTSTQTNRGFDGAQFSFKQADTVADATEAIARLELDWDGFPNHAVQLNLEGAYNLLDGTLLQVEDDGAGPVAVAVPGGNSRVEETRGDFLLKDTWTQGRYELDYGLGAEASRISQTGDAEQDRSFFFFTPQGTLSYNSRAGGLTRLHIAREIAQLDFNDFISTTVFEDDDLALGNPDLRPDKTWVAELSHERRFGDISVVKATAYHHWITDVLDLLPLTATYEVPGNIGDGRRWGLVLENAMPLGRLGIAGARLDLKFRWEGSKVTDPVTGLERVLSATAGFRGPPEIRFREGNDYVIDVGFRQDFEAARVAWGWRAAEQAGRPVFKVNEKELYDEGVLLNVFVETTRWLGLKTRLEGHNLLNYSETRDRTIFAGERDLTPVNASQLRSRTVGRRINLTLTGSF